MRGSSMLLKKGMNINKSNDRFSVDRRHVTLNESPVKSSMKSTIENDYSQNMNFMKRRPESAANVNIFRQMQRNAPNVSSTQQPTISTHYMMSANAS